MTELLKRKSVDFLVEQFWRKGYLTLSRKFGTYLPEPTTVGGFEVDIVARQKNKYAIGLTLNDEDLKDQNALIKKLRYLATRQTRKGNMPVMLFVGVKEENFNDIKILVDQFEEDIRKNIKLFQIMERQTIVKRRTMERTPPLFS
jgi:hypothetical protein